MNDRLTAKQNRHLWWLLGELDLKDCVADLVMEETGGRTAKVSELEFIECMNLINRLEQYTRKPQENRSQEGAKELDRKRKGVIKAICAYGELTGRHWDADYAKGIATRAAGRDRFNELTEADLTRVYAEFCRKQKTAAVRKELDDGVTAGRYTVTADGKLNESL